MKEDPRVFSAFSGFGLDRKNIRKEDVFVTDMDGNLLYLRMFAA